MLLPLCSLEKKEIFMNERRKLEDCINLYALDHKKLFGYFLVVFKLQNVQYMKIACWIILLLRIT